MAAYNKFEAFVEHLAKKYHDLHGDTLRTYLSNAVPSASLDAVKADLAEITPGNGYAAGGVDLQNTISRTGGTATIVTVDPVFTASGGSVGPLQYAVHFNDTPTTPVVDPLIAWHDYGAPITLLDGESLTIDLAGNKLADFA